MSERLIAHKVIMGNALTAEARRRKVKNTMNFMAGTLWEKEVRRKRDSRRYLYKTGMKEALPFPLITRKWVWSKCNAQSPRASRKLNLSRLSSCAEPGGGAVNIKVNVMPSRIHRWLEGWRDNEELAGKELRSPHVF
jgi:hypothetical protein